MNGFEKRKLNFELQEWRWKVYDLERPRENVDAAIHQIRGRFRSLDRNLDLSYALQRRSVIDLHPLRSLA
jgi:hypothetical protein